MERLAFIMDSLCFGGAEIQTIDLVNNLAEQGCRILLFSMDSVDTLRHRIHPSAEVFVLKKRVYLDPGCLGKIVSELKGFQPEVLFLVNTYSMLYGYLAGFFLPGPVRKILIHHSTFLETALDRAKNILYKKIMNRMDRIVFVSHRQKDYWVSRYRINPEKSLVIYNGVDIKRFEEYGTDREAVLNRLGFPPSDIILGINACLAPEKRHEDLIDGLCLLLSEGYPVRLLIIGDGSRRGFIEEHICRRGVGDRVYITGFVEDVREYLACVDISVLASSTEALSMAAIESMAMSKPVVLTDVGGAQELVQSFENGMIYEPRNVTALCQALKYVIDNKLLEPMGRKSLAKAKTTFEKAEMIRNYISLFSS
jgi:glycosyltransferase involved in cell wall biosynthesis